MSPQRATSVMLIGAVVLLSVVAVGLGSASGSGRADLVGSGDLLADRPGELALTARGGAAGEIVAESATGGDTTPAVPLPVTVAGPATNSASEGEGTTGASASSGATVAAIGGAAPDPSVLRSIDATQPALPRSLSIPSLGVESPIVPVGLEPDGAMQIPGAAEAGWYLPGRLPGAATGSAVIAAHVDYEGEPGVFIDLRRIEEGSEVVVTDEDGTVHRFTVTERFQVDKDELPTAELFRSGGDPVLTLVTCGGAFDPGDRSYSDNIVVRAVPVAA